MAVKPAAAWTTRWSSGVGGAGARWSAGYIAAGPAIFTKGAASVANWQSAVAAPAAATAFVAGLNSVNFAQVQTVVQGAGQQKYTTSGTAKPGKYNSFATVFQPKLSNITASLDASNPHGPRGSAQNRTRLNVYLDQVAATRGQNH